MKKIILLIFPFLLWGVNPLLENKDIIDIGSNVAKQYVEIPLSKIYLPPKYEKDSNELVYELRKQSEETKCITDDFNHENCPIDKFRYECDTKFDTTDGYSQRVDTVLYSNTFCKDGEIKVDGYNYYEIIKGH